MLIYLKEKQNMQQDMMLNLIRNLGDKPFYYKSSERLAQLIIMPYRVVNKDTATAKRTGGFGSTNK